MNHSLTVFLQIYSAPWPEVTQNNMFPQLKKLLNAECMKLTQSSNILKAVEDNPSYNWKEKLWAENILLKHGKFD